MSDIFENVLTKEMRELYPALSNFKEDFYLAGGTGFALLVGHRISVDFDLFSNKPIKKTLLDKVDEVFSKFERQVIVNKKTELTVLINEVKVTFLEYPFPVVLSKEKNIPIEILSAKEILATKAYSIGRRGAYKDYVDVYIGLNEGVAGLEEIIRLAEEKYGGSFNGRIFLEQLTYLDDIEEADIIMLDSTLPSRQELINFFSREISKLEL